MKRSRLSIMHWMLLYRFKVIKGAFVFFVLLFAPFKGFSAAPVTHLFLAEKWMEAILPFEGKDLRSFISGNLFPDIRYLGEIRGEETHEKGVSLKRICASSSPFLAGMLLHSYVDEVRENLVVQCGIYSSIDDYASGYKATLLKLMEDEILYFRIDSSKMSEMLASITEEEFEWGMSENTLKKWHLFLAFYFQEPPSKLLAYLAERDLPFLNVPKEVIQNWNKIFPALVQDERFLKYVSQLEKTFIQAFHQFSSEFTDRLSS